MLNSVFLDTNIIVDLFDNDRVFSHNSVTAVKLLLEEGAVLYVNSDTLTTIFYLLRSQKKATFIEAIQAIKEISTLCKLISIVKKKRCLALTFNSSKKRFKIHVKITLLLT